MLTAFCFPYSPLKGQASLLEWYSRFDPLAQISALPKVVSTCWCPTPILYSDSHGTIGYLGGKGLHAPTSGRRTLPSKALDTLFPFPSYLRHVIVKVCVQAGALVPALTFQGQNFHLFVCTVQRGSARVRGRQRRQDRSRDRRRRSQQERDIGRGCDRKRTPKHKPRWSA